MEKPALVYTLYIATSAEKLWQGLTDPDLTEQYFGGNRVESDWTAGSDFILRMKDGRIDVKGKVLECEPPRFLVMTWAQQTDLRDLPSSRVSYRIARHGKVSGLTLTVTPEGEIPGEILAASRLGWAMILSGLKTLLETGKPLPLTVEEAMAAIGKGAG